MEYKLLGNTGVKVSALCFGTMSFGGDADEKTSAAMFNRCREIGIPEPLIMQSSGGVIPARRCETRQPSSCPSD